MIKLQFKLPQALISRGFTRRTVFHALLFSKKGILTFSVILLISQIPQEQQLNINVNNKRLYLNCLKMET